VVELLSRLMPAATPGISDVGHEIGNLVLAFQTDSNGGRAALAREVLAWAPPAQSSRSASFGPTPAARLDGR
jgi:hypothetical protein